jgi:hypothetical protein
MVEQSVSDEVGAKLFAAGEAGEPWAVLLRGADSNPHLLYLKIPSVSKDRGTWFRGTPPCPLVGSRPSNPRSWTPTCRTAETERPLIVGHTTPTPPITAAEEASKLLKHPQIAPRLLLVKKQATDRTIANVAITKERVIEMLIEDRELARAAHQASAAVRATELLGKELFRMFVDRREQGKPGDFDKLPREELEQSIVDELRAGGIPEEYALAFLETRKQQFRH